MLRVKFDINIEQVNNDYRPIIWPIKYPYWCSGQNNKEFHLIAYVDSLEQLFKQWPEAEHIEQISVDKIEYTDRFRKPEWYNE